MSKHLMSFWEDELRDLQEAVVNNKGVSLTFHFESRMVERDIEMIDVVHAIMTGKIVEGFDIGQYPNYRNPDPLRNIIGEDLKGNKVTIGVALKKNSYCFTTLYSGVTDRLLYIFD